MTLNDLTDPIASFVGDFRNRRVMVLGDAILDEYLVGDCSRISPEAPVPVLKVTSTRRVLGGAANTAANIVSLGGQATLIAFVGDDEGGRTLKRCAAQAGVDLRSVDTGAPTLRKARVVGQHQQIVRLDYEDVRPATTDNEAAILQQFDECVGGCDVVVISDYAKGFVSRSLAQEIIRRAHVAGRQVVVDPRPQHRDCYIGCDYLTPNWKEARALLGLPDADVTNESVEAVATQLSADIGANIVLTLGSHGISFCARGGAERFALPTLAREVFDVSGAGDTVVAAFALAVASGADHPSAVLLANRAASVAVSKFGTATVTAEEVLQDSDALRLVPRRALSSLAATLRARGKRIVTINGSFDLLHGGHLYILNQARRQGDVLIVGLNSDASVRGYKGPTRPIVPERRRAEMLLALRMVDYVHIFDEPNPIAFLEEVRPDVHVNGAEYGQDCVESEAVRRGGGELYLVDRVPDLSTSGLLEQLHPSEPQ
ncbi:MAG TPA: bifunctional heptose 7-phosphate kinase/heptose 1-phosphate adenyltransferase [Vicinamibacterales bacterium]|jgi:D-beta-D-heptose 7-phosphate kinase/D-beta-D-heptose 1-phosphate adenosyltransferase|nr:bifunctional heptose 7-phosphate kinase/heptose 1-phosphate adenyltransferase [Vicinamibacterales bacterium]